MREKLHRLVFGFVLLIFLVNNLNVSSFFFSDTTEENIEFEIEDYELDNECDKIIDFQYHSFFTSNLNFTMIKKVNFVAMQENPYNEPFLAQPYSPPKF
jgi:hypothetical protein